MNQKEISSSLEQNVQSIKEVFCNDNTLIVRYFENQQMPKVWGCVLYLDGMAKSELITENIMKPILQNAELKDGKNLIEMVQLQVLASSDVSKKKLFNEILSDMLSGKTLLLFEGFPEALIINTQGFESRAITEPESEKIVRGPREGFTEPIMVNLSMIRRKLETPNLKFYFTKLGAMSQTDVCICYIEDVANPLIVDEVKKRLSKITIDGLVESGYIAELIRDSPLSPFKTVGSTERPDVVAAKLLEGRIAIVVDGTPTVLTVPCLFMELFQVNEDYYINFYFASINRLLRIMGFIITVSAPAVYVALLTFHQEMIPTTLLLSISAARQGVPFPTIVEVLLLLLTFEILRETGIRMPTNIGQALSIVGALVLGQASVEARFVSAPVVIVVALSGITGLMMPKIKGAVVLIRLVMLLVSAFIGFYGFIFGFTCILLQLCSMRSFGVPYLMELTTLNPEDLKDTAVRAPLWFMKKRPSFISGENKNRQRPGGGAAS